MTQLAPPALRAQRHPVASPQPAARRPLPRAPVLDWRWLLPGAADTLPSVGGLPHRLYLTSGRAALRAALRQIELAPGTTVLVPSYHCPTMVAPIVIEGLAPAYIPIGADGLPLLDAIDPVVAGRARVMFAAHYFGLPTGLAAVQAWCRARDIVLVEDCAHSYFGWAGAQPVGTWGDYAIASLSKFFPLREGGLLGSAQRPLRAPPLRRPGLGAELRSAFDVLEHSHDHRRLQGWHQLAAPFFHAKRRLRPGAPPAAVDDDAPAVDGDAMMRGCDMGRSEETITWAARALHAAMAPGRIVDARRRNFALLTERLAAAPGARPLCAVLPDGAAPYVLPLWVDGAERADRVYLSMRRAGLPVFRWDRLWPGTPRAPAVPEDHGPRWSRHLLQLLCHQDLRPTDIERLADETLALLRDAR